MDWNIFDMANTKPDMYDRDLNWKKKSIAFEWKSLKNLEKKCQNELLEWKNFPQIHEGHGKFDLGGKFHEKYQSES